MAYGLEITGSNDKFVLNTALTSTVYLAITNEGTTSGNDGAISGYSAGDLVVARPVSGQGIFGGKFQLSTPTINVPAKYYILKAISGSTSVTANGSTYGIVVFKADGTTKIYDSRSTSKGFGVKQVWSKNAFLGHYQGNTLQPTNATVYTSTSSTDYDSTYVSLNGSMESGASAAFNSFFYDSTTGTGRVLFHSFINFGGFLGLGTISMTNFSEIIVGDLIT